MKYINYIVIIFLISGCAVPAVIEEPSSSYSYQLITVKPSNTNTDTTVFSNEDLIVGYDFWNDNGAATIGIYNKSDKFIYWQVNETFFIKNGITLDYYTNTTKTTSTVKSISTDIFKIYGFPDILSRSDGITISETQQSVIIIPPKAARYIRSFPLLSEPIIISKDSINPLLNFDKNNSPIQFSNVISYKIEDEPVKRFSNDFYISETHSYLKTEFIKYSTDGKRTPYTPYKANNRFYIKHSIWGKWECSFGKCNYDKAVEKCKNCCAVGSAYCWEHINK